MSGWLRFMCSWERCEPKRKRSRLFFNIFVSLRKMLPFISNTGEGFAVGEFLRKPGQCVLERAAQAGGGVTLPGSVQETFRSCANGHSLVGNVGNRCMVGLNNLGGLVQPCWFYDSMNAGFSVSAGRTPLVQSQEDLVCLVEEVVSLRITNRIQTLLLS